MQSLRGVVALALRRRGDGSESLVRSAMDAIARGLPAQTAVDHVWEAHTEHVDLMTVIYLAGASDDLAADMAVQFPVIGA
jgi:signal transduction protein with GAF and PtsI domain